MASKYGHMAVVQVLLDHQADVNAANMVRTIGVTSRLGQVLYLILGLAGWVTLTDTSQL